MDSTKYSSVQQIQPTASDEHTSLTESDNTGVKSSQATQISRKKSKSVGGALVVWWLETLLLLLMLATLAAICITTWKYWNKPVPKWPHSISVNTINAVYGVILKTTIVGIVSTGLSQLKWTWYKKARPLRDIEYWDQASRGTWGSLLLIFRLRGRHIIATIGALILILALALDPFIQLLVLYSGCPIVRDDEQAIIPTRQSYSEINGAEAAGYYVPTALGHAANAGILGAANTQISATCETGNCTFFEPYHTMAFCSHCEDISDSVSINCQPVGYGKENVTELGCNFTVPGGFYNNVYLGNEESAWTPVLSFSVQNSYAIGTSLIIITNNLTTTPGLDAEKFQTCPAEGNIEPWLCRGYGAANCSVVPCVQTYTARVDNGHLQETLVDSFTELTYANVGSSFSALNVKCLSSSVRDQLVEQLNYPIDATTEWIGYRGADSNGSSYYWQQPSPIVDVISLSNNWTPGPVVDVPPECVYDMSSTTAYPAQTYIVSTAKGNVTTGEGGSSFVGEIIPRSLFNSGNVSFNWIDSSFASMATAMTVYLRQATYTNFQENTSVPISTLGIAYQIETCMRVRWLYILYPAILVAITLIFFIGMVIETFSRDEIGDWKDSALALIFHGMMNPSGGIAAIDASQISTTEDMKKVAEKMFVSISPMEEEMSQVWECTVESVDDGSTSLRRRPHG